MKTQMPVWLFAITLIIFIIIGIAGIVMFFKTQSYKKSVLLRNETLPPLKQIKLKWYQNWGPVFGFLISVIMALGVMAVTGMFIS
ncbi:hypothetical protein [Mycoplasma todarodis]|uniref:Uncharacterized protein n=1 Tax=Mycoplasma todarodis TaxID=1937191 RepID=A0A4R0XTJ1_9MOLU|nr:hypothetical protein [Mycoplasma todarodis]TCG11814.1 hypothetical protein C4B25_00655 [Mycoplasma todarodis]